MTKQEFTKLANKHLVALDGYKIDKNGNTKIEIFGIEKLYSAINYTHCCTELPKNNCTLNKPEESERIVEEFAIDFYEWRSTTPIKNINQFTNEETIKIFKEERNL